MPHFYANPYWYWSGTRADTPVSHGYYYLSAVNGATNATQALTNNTQLWPQSFNAGTIPVTSQTAYVWQKWTATTVNNYTFDAEQRWEWTPRPATTDAWTEWQEIPAKRARVRHQTERQKLIARNRARTATLRERIAQRRAQELLFSMLDEIQIEQWQAERAFTIETADGARRYRIRHGVAGNIMLVKDGDREAADGNWLRRFCFHAYHPDGSIPVEDHVLAQKLFIESDEASFLRLANPA